MYAYRVWRDCLKCAALCYRLGLWEFGCSTRHCMEFKTKKDKIAQWNKMLPFWIKLRKFTLLAWILLSIWPNNNLKSGSFKVFIGRKSIASLHLLATEYTFGKLFPEHFRVSSFQISMTKKIYIWNFGIKEVLKWNCPEVIRRFLRKKSCQTFFSECSLPSTVSRKTIKRISHHVR